METKYNTIKDLLGLVVKRQKKDAQSIAAIREGVKVMSSSKSLAAREEADLNFPIGTVEDMNNYAERDPDLILLRSR